MINATFTSFSSIAALACSFVLFAAKPSQANNIVLNGGFEIDTPLPANPSNPNANASQQPTDWTLTSLDANHPHAFVIAGVGVGGSQAVDFNGYDVNANAILSQAISTTNGQSYDFSFYFGTIGSASTSTSTLRVEVIGASGDLLNTTVSLLGIHSVTQHALQFTANSPSTTIRFTDLSPNTASIDGVLDSVNVSATVPEPSSIALAGISLIGLTAAVRHRRSRQRNCA